MSIYWLDQEKIAFPHHQHANEYGILAAGGDLSMERIIFAYQNGIFPWYNEGEPILWWSPDPRFVLFPEDLKIAKSMRSYFNQGKFAFSFDTAFSKVIGQCKVTDREGQGGQSWITPEMQAAYIQLHELGYAHSVEVWQNGQLVGGLYGIAMGKVFFGESMFTEVSNASKFGFINLVKHLIPQGFELIDCQQETKHLASLGAEAIPRPDFLKLLTNLIKSPQPSGRWEYPKDQVGEIHFP